MTRQTLVNAIVTNGNVPEFQAEQLVDYYRRVIRVATFNVHDGYQLRHGALLDRDVIHKAIKQMTANTGGK